MRFMIMIKADKNTEAGVLPDVAALNIANELVKLKARGDQDGKVGVRLKSLRDKVDAALERGQQLEL